jgi:hypothetical protein
MNERRRHVRAKPLPELPAHVLSSVSPEITEPLDVVDISVSGIAIVQGMKKAEVGAKVPLRLVLPSTTLALDAVVRWVARGMVGLELDSPSEEASTALGRYVGELLERGSRA